jgi:hypothetical protein
MNPEARTPEFWQLRDLHKALNADAVKKATARGGAPAWLKDFAGQLEDPEYCDLSPADRGFLKDLRLLALRRGNKIRNDESYLRGQLRLTARTQVDPRLHTLRDAGFLEPYCEKTNSAATALIPPKPILESVSPDSALEVEVEVEVKDLEVQVHRFSIAEAWLAHSPPLTKHRPALFSTKPFKTSMKNALAVYSAAEIAEAIANYATVLASDEHYFSHRWTLRDFLVRGLNNFVAEAKPLENFANRVRPGADRGMTFAQIMSDRPADQDGGLDDSHALPFDSIT